MIVTAAALVTTSCKQEAEIPTPPDLSALSAAYENPDGSVNATSVVAAFQEARRVATIVSDSGFGPFLRESQQRVRENVDQFLEQIRQRDRLHLNDVELDMAVHVRRVCNGWDDPNAPPNPDKNGTVEMTAVVRNEDIQPVAWGGTVGRCLQTNTISGRSARLLIDGQIAVSGTAVQLPMLVQFSGLFGSITGTASGRFDFRVTPEGQIEVRVPATGGGSVIVFVGNGEVGVRGSNGRFVCSDETHGCTGPNGETFQF